MFMAGDSILF